MMGGLTLPRWAPRPIGRLYFRLFHVIGLWIVGSEVTRLRASLGLTPFRQMFDWWLSPALALGLFPPWFGPPQRDWPAQVQLLDFPLAGRCMRPLPQDLVEFSKNAERLIAFTFGTGMRHAGRLFQRAIEACRALEARAIFLTSFRSQLPDTLPGFVRHCEFAPFEELFPLCSVVVHHGGIGTVAETLASGTPQLILPFAFDQLDNAVRVKRLRAGTFLGPRRQNHRAIAAALSQLTNPETVAGSRQLAERLSLRNGIRTAVDGIEHFAK
jgi:rhamnosyltransferase subunit B